MIGPVVQVPQSSQQDEQALLVAFRASDERGKQSILDHAVSTAEDWPAPRLIVGGDA